MFKIIYSTCLECGSNYFISKDTKLNRFLYECVDCKLEITFLHVQPAFKLKTWDDYEVFLKYYKAQNISELKHTIFH